MARLLLRLDYRFLLVQTKCLTFYYTISGGKITLPAYFRKDDLNIKVKSALNLERIPFQKIVSSRNYIADDIAVIKRLTPIPAKAPYKYALAFSTESFFVK